VPNAPPVAAPAVGITDENTAVEVTLDGFDLETCGLTFSIVAGPSNGSLSPITPEACMAGNPSTDTALITYTPAAGFSGIDSFTFTVSDGSQESSAATVAIIVKP